MLRFKLCRCLKHGRLIGHSGTIPFEIGSREMAAAMFKSAEELGTFEPGQLAAAKKVVAESMMAVKDAWIDPELQERIVLWNTAAGTVNNPDEFAKTDFHDYHDLIDGFGAPDPQSS